ncbi:hypothetical protein F444_03229 [Phytophthora nicotianae P1976]|uniref:Crinkler effector protein N-terminal domain-containing protein n=1 Tax=Phytophthora nicotianae P1976 TaxID=1317066 RepID=A0A081AUV2_PHYNI|nr:hypothetical protein F444_03229 [Phytophthora nicotianae P1976]
MSWIAPFDWLKYERERPSLTERNWKHGEAVLCARWSEGKRVPRDDRWSESVGDLKKAIRKEKQNKIKCDADELELFLARKSDDKWLDGSGAEAVTLDEHGHPEGFTHMDPLLWIKNPKNF